MMFSCTLFLYKLILILLLCAVAQAKTITIPPSSIANVNTVLLDATGGDTVILQPGDYAPCGIGLNVNKLLYIKAYSATFRCVSVEYGAYSPIN